MMTLLGWVSVVLLSLSQCWKAGTTKSGVQVIGGLLLGGYAAARADCPVLGLAVVSMVSGLIRFWRARHGRRRARSVDVTMACDRFERARRAVSESLGTRSR
jgi:hypothetical protein